jgi:hypothetical protein
MTRLLEVAHLLRAAGQHISEHRLGLGGTGLSGRPRPLQGGSEIRFTRLLFGKQAFGSIATDVAGDALSSSVMKCERPGVAVYPGLNTLTRMSRPLRSTIQVRANERTAALTHCIPNRRRTP